MSLMEISVDVILQELMAIPFDVISSAVYIRLECRFSMSEK